MKTWRRILWHSSGTDAVFFTVDIVLQEIPQSKVAGGDIYKRTWRSCCWKMAADHLCICKVLSQKFFYTTINVRRCCMKMMFHAVVRLQKPSAYHGTVVPRWNSFDFNCSYIIKKYSPVIEVAIKPHNYVFFSGCKGCSWIAWRFSAAQIRRLWVLICKFKTKVVFISPQNVPWWSDVNYRCSKALKCKSFTNVFVLQ